MPQIITSPTLLQTSLSQAEYYIWYFGKELEAEAHTTCEFENE